MSYILEALKKADQERGIGAVPGLATPPEVERPPNRSWRWLWVVAAALLSVNVVLAVMLLKARDTDIPVAAQTSLESQVSPTNDRPVQPAPASGEVMASEAPVREKRVPLEQAPVLSSGGLVVLPEPANVRSPGPSMPPKQESDHRMGATANGRDVPQLKTWYELPQSVRDRLNLPRLDLHVYSEDPQNRFIMVNLKKYREGERLESGLVLEEILPEGMVMSYQGERFLVDK